MTDPAHDLVLIVDFGSQVTQLIARRVREAGVYSEVVPFSQADAAIAERRPRAVILSGGPASVTGIDTPRASKAIFAAGVPVLGICYGQQAMVEALGGTVETSDHQEFGRAYLDVGSQSPLFDGIWQAASRHQVWMSHGDRVTGAAAGLLRHRHLGGRALRRHRR